MARSDINPMDVAMIFVNSSVSASVGIAFTLLMACRREDFGSIVERTEGFVR